MKIFICHFSYDKSFFNPFTQVRIILRGSADVGYKKRESPKATLPVLQHHFSLFPRVTQRDTQILFFLFSSPKFLHKKNIFQYDKNTRETLFVE